jgi:threonine/homoserine/homoserine lactone efflux protein
VHSQLLPFIGTAILIAPTPGADTALVVRNALVAGAPSARRTALGTSTGLLVWGAAWALAWLSVYATVVARAGDVLRRPAVRRALDRATGVVLIGLGVRLALTRR